MNDKVKEIANEWRGTAPTTYHPVSSMEELIELANDGMPGDEGTDLTTAGLPALLLQPDSCALGYTHKWGSVHHIFAQEHFYEADLTDEQFDAYNSFSLPYYFVQAAGVSQSAHAFFESGGYLIIANPYSFSKPTKRGTWNGLVKP